MLYTCAQETFTEALKYNEGLRQHLPKVADDLNPLRVQVRPAGLAGASQRSARCPPWLNPCCSCCA